MMVEDELFTHEGLVIAVGQCLGLFYANDGMGVSRYPEWIQGALNVLVGLFRRYGMVENVAKSKAIKCHPGGIRSEMSEDAVG